MIRDIVIVTLSYKLNFTLYGLINGMRYLIFMMIFCGLGVNESSGFIRSTTNEGIPALWYTRCIPIWLHSTGSKVLSQPEIEDDLLDSLSSWDGVECSELGFAHQGETMQIPMIGYDTTPNARNQNIVSFVQQADLWIDDPRAAGLTTITMCANDTPACAAGTIIDADIQLNEGYFEFTSSQSPNIRMDLTNTLTHEIGHLLGLDHSSDLEATMYEAAPYGETEKRSLAQDDIDGLCSIFPDGQDYQCILNSYDLQAPIEPQPAPSMSNSSEEQGCRQKATQVSFSSYLFLLFAWIINSVYRQEKFL